jgi:SAM-dependent methyltransferase
MSSPKCPVCDLLLLPAFRLRAVDGPYRNSESVHFRDFLRCGGCGFLISEFQDLPVLEEYYSSLPVEYHEEHDQDMARYYEIKEIVEQVQPKRILDYGCGTGSFLSSISGAGIERYGTELAEAASQLASGRGVTILSEKELVSEMEHAFDVITAIDVVEHATDIVALRRLFARLLKPGGHLILLTGNLRSRAAALVGRYWYYMHYAEHLNFFSNRSIRTWLEPDFSKFEVTLTCHHPLSFWEAAKVAKAWALFPVKWTLRTLGTNVGGLNMGLPVRNDHMIVRAVRRSD